MMARRVLFIGHKAELAGAEIALVNVAAHLDRRRFLPSVLLPRAGAVAALLEAQHVPVYTMPPPSYSVTSEQLWDAPVHLRAVAPLREAILSLSPDVVVVNTNTIPHAIIAALTTDIPLVAHLHGFVTRRQSEWHSERERASDRLWLQFADAIVACSPWVARFYEDLLGVPVSVVPNTTAISNTTDALPASPPLFVMLATLEAHKRPDLFIEAAAQLRRKHPEIAFECRLYGDGAREQRDGLQKLVAQHGLESCFTLHPASRETTALYQAATCAVVASDIEPFSMVAIEAAAHRRPVIATRSGGPDDIVIDGETGVLIDTGDVAALANAMLAVIRDPSRAARMGEAAQARFEALYAPSAVIPVYEALLDVVIAEKHSARRRLAQPAARYFMTKHGG